MGTKTFVKLKAEPYKAIANKTRIDIGERKLEEIRQYYDKHKKGNYMPPIFDEFIICLDVTDSIMKTCIKTIENNLQLEQFYEVADVFEKNKIIKNVMDIADEILSKGYKTYKKEKKVYNTFYVKYKDSVNIEITVYDVDNKIIGVLEACYLSKEDNYFLNVETDGFDLKDEKKKQETKDFFTSAFDVFLTVSYYMQNFNSDIEYSKIEVRDNKQNSKNKYNGGYSQKIVLKSKKKRYIIKDTDDFKKRNEANYRVSSWLTRGHYRRCGKDKVIKYILPTVHTRKKANAGDTNNKTYEIK